MASYRDKSFTGYASRFWLWVDKTPGLGPNGDCWLWNLAPASGGYGSYSMLGRKYKAHRFSVWIREGKEPPEDMVVCHLCDNPICVRPDHLYLGTQLENIADKVAKGRQTQGSAVWNSKLSNKLVYGLRHIWPEVPLPYFSEVLGVNRSTLGSARRGDTWKTADTYMKNQDLAIDVFPDLYSEDYILVCECP